MLKVNYDKEKDVLYLRVADMNNSYGEEVTPGLVVFFDLDTNEASGVTIFDFVKKYNSGTLGLLPIPIKINFEKDVLSQIGLNYSTRKNQF